ERVAEAPPVGLRAAGAAGGPVVPEALIAHRMTDRDCLPMDDLANAGAIETGLLDASYPIYFIPCWAGAYNVGSKVYVERSPGDDAEMAFAEFTPEQGWTATTQVVNYR